MHKIEKTVLVPYSCEQMFTLVSDVDSYPDFLPWCGGSSVHSSDEEGMQASVVISFAGIKQTFTTNNVHDYPHNINVSLVKGPFSALSGNWQFKPLGSDACKVIYTMQYEFSSKALETIIGPVFNRIANSFIDSFTKRAQDIYE